MLNGSCPLFPPRADPHVRLYRPKPKALLARSGLESLLSPEEHCFLDSALEGQQRLADAFVTRLSTPDGVEKAMEGLKGSMVSKPYKGQQLAGIWAKLDGSELDRTEG